MAINQIAGKWQQMKGELKKQWGKLTDDDWTEIEGDIEKFAGKLRERYGYSAEDARRIAEQEFVDDILHH